MSDVELDPAFVSAMEMLMESEAARRYAITTFAFREFALAIQTFHRVSEEIAAMLRLAAEEEARGEVQVVRTTDRETEERMEVEEEEDLFHRRHILLEQAEEFDRMCIMATFEELALIVNEAFRPCVSHIYSHAWGIKVDRVLPLPSHALDKLHKNPERHLPPFMHKEARVHRPSYQEYLAIEHAKEFERSMHDVTQNPAPDVKAFLLTNNEPLMIEDLPAEQTLQIMV